MDVFFDSFGQTRTNSVNEFGQNCKRKHILSLNGLELRNERSSRLGYGSKFKVSACRCTFFAAPILVELLTSKLIEYIPLFVVDPQGRNLSRILIFLSSDHFSEARKNKLDISYFAKQSNYVYNRRLPSGTF